MLYYKIAPSGFDFFFPSPKQIKYDLKLILWQT